MNMSLELTWSSAARTSNNSDEEEWDLGEQL